MYRGVPRFGIGGTANNAPGWWRPQGGKVLVEGDDDQMLRALGL